MGLLEGNQLMFVVFLALVISGVLRVALDLRGRATWHHLQASCNRLASSSLHELDEALTQKAKAVAAVASHSHLSGPAWDLPPHMVQHFPQGGRLDPSEFKLHIKVLAFDRADSILRCLDSLENAIYSSDLVDLDIFIDNTFNAQSGKWNVAAERRTRGTQTLMQRVDNFTWSHGSKKVIYRTQNGGIQPQWLEAWWPESVNDFAFVVEDDMEVSPLYYQYFKMLISAYYYNASNFNPQVYGISFQRQYFVAGIGGAPVRSSGVPYLYQLVGTWGQFLFPIGWKDFRLWYDLRRFNVSRQPLVEGLKTTAWYKRKGNKLWTPWIIKWALANSMFNIYPSPPGNKSLSISHRDKGSNFGVDRGVDAQLLVANDVVTGAADLGLVSLEGGAKLRGAGSQPISGGSITPEAAWWGRELPAMHQLSRRDFCFREMKHLPPARSLEELHALVEIVNRARSVALIIVPAKGLDLARNWLCHLDGGSVRNFIFVVTCGKQAADLSNAGHAVFHLSSEDSTISTDTSHGLNAWTPQHMRLVLTILSLGFDVLLANPDTIWIADPFAFNVDKSFDVWGHVQESAFSNSFLMLRSRPASIRAVSLLLTRWERLGEKFEELQAKNSGQQQPAGWLFGNNLNFRIVDTVPVHLALNFTLGAVAPVVLGPTAASKGELVASLQSNSLWVIDDYDLTCKAVTCRKRM